MFAGGLKVPIFANVKIGDIDSKFRLFKELGLFPEIYIDSFSLGHLSHSRLDELNCLFRQNSMLVTLHAPFWDLSLGSVDEEIRKLSVKRIVTSLNIAKSLNAKNVVFHSGYTETSYISSPELEWNSRFYASLAEILDYAGSFGVKVALENVYERDAGFFMSACEVFRNKGLGICFDCGHYNVYAASPVEEWLGALAPHLRAVHLHSNNGRADEHLAVGDGNIDFGRIFRIIAEKKASPLITIENKVEAYLVNSVKILRSEKYFRLLNNFMPDIA
jgi:sugar phosphate isomerase/epimerase